MEEARKARKYWPSSQRPAKLINGESLPPPSMRLLVRKEDLALLVLEPLGDEHVMADTDVLVLTWFHPTGQPDVELIANKDCGLLAIDLGNCMRYEVWEGPRLITEGGFPLRVS